MTTPDYVLVMKKVAAIVTDEGGVTCHAAIVSENLIFLVLLEQVTPQKYLTMEIL